MIAGLRSWLLALIAASLVCALADALMPKGAVKGVGRLVCGLVLVSTILSPLGSLDLEAGQSWLESHLTWVELQRGELEQQVNSQMKVIIEQKYAAYIVDKAAQLGAVCSVQVECRQEDGLYLPLRAEIRGTIPPHLQTELVQIIVQDLEIPEGQIDFSEEEAP